MKAHTKRNLLIIAALLMLTLKNVPISAQSEYELGLSARDFMVRKYSKVEDEVILNRVKSIWNKVVRVVDKRSGVTYRIDVLDTDKVGAWAYPGGFVLFTRGLVDIATTDDELAFVIAHELGHQARGHVDKPMEPELEDKFRDIIVEHGIDGVGLVGEFVSEVTKRKEIEADHYGVLYTSLAGYDVSAAFQILDRVITSDKTKTHPSKEARQRKLQQRLEDIVSKLEVFRAGVVFYNIGQYEYSEKAFLNFLSVYPSREVYNNLAATFHQQALSCYTPERDIPTKKSIQMDVRSRAEDMDIRARNLLEPEAVFKESLNRVVEIYKRAIEQDPGYAISYNNLGCAYDDLGEFDFAAVWLRKATRMQEGYKEAYNNLGVAYIHLGEFEQAVVNLERAIQLDNSCADAYFNLAMAYEALGKSKQAVSENLILFMKYGPGKRSNLMKIAREKLGLQTQDSTDNNRFTGPPRRRFLRRDLEKEFLGPPALSVDVIPSKRIRIYLYPDKGTKLITYGLRGTVICIVADIALPGLTPETVRAGNTKERSIAVHGEPQQITEMNGLQNYLYPDEGLLISFRDEKVNSWILWFEME